jgi:hypothetical protein
MLAESLMERRHLLGYTTDVEMEMPDHVIAYLAAERIRELAAMEDDDDPQTRIQKIEV